MCNLKNDDLKTMHEVMNVWQSAVTQSCARKILSPPSLTRNKWHYSLLSYTWPLILRSPTRKHLFSIPSLNVATDFLPPLTRNQSFSAPLFRTRNQWFSPPLASYIYIYILYTRCIGWVGVGWQRRCKTRQSLRELDNQGAFFRFAFGGRHGWWSS